MGVTAAVMEEKSGKFNIDTLDLDAPQSYEVLVKITATGICHTDLHARDGYFAMPFPAVYGHEGAGVVLAVGGAVEHLAVGDHVVISFPWCGECEHCREDRRSYCQRGRELKSGGVRMDGSVTMRRKGAPVYGSFFQQSSFASHALAPARNAVKVRRDAPLEISRSPRLWPPDRGRSRDQRYETRSREVLCRIRHRLGRARSADSGKARGL